MNNVTLDSKLNNIRNSTYAATVRESIASAIEQIKDQVNSLTPVSGNSTVNIETYVNSIVNDRLNGYALSDSVYSKTEANSTFAKTNSVYSSDVADSTFFKNADVKTELDSSEENDGHVYSSKYVDDTFLKKTDVQNENDDSEGNDEHVYSSKYVDDTFVKSSTLDSSINTAISNIQVNNSGLSSTITGINNDIDDLGSSISSLDDRVSSVENALNGTAASNISNRISTLENSINGTDETDGLANQYDELSTGIDNLDSEISNLETELSGLNTVTGAKMVLDARDFPTIGYFNKSCVIRGTASEVMVDGEYIKAYRTSDYIPIIPGETLSIEFYSVSNLHRILFYDQNKNFVYYYPQDSEEFPNDGNTKVKPIIETPDNVYYMRVAGRTAENRNQVIISHLNGLLDPIVDSMARNDDYYDNHLYLRKIDFTMSSGKYVRLSSIYGNSIVTSNTHVFWDESSGTWKHVSGSLDSQYINEGRDNYPRFFISEPIDVRGIDRLKVKCLFTSVVGYLFRIGSSDDFVIETGDDEKLLGKVSTYYIDVPDKAEYFILSTDMSGQDEDYIRDFATGTYNNISVEAISNGKKFQNENFRIKEEISMEKIPYEKLLTGPVLCIGDSLTVGSRPSGSGQNYTSAVSMAYPEWLASLTGLNISSSAKSGYTATDWWEDDTISKDFSGYNTFIVWLGTNTRKSSDQTIETDQEFNTNYQNILDVIISSTTVNNVSTAKIFIGYVFAVGSGKISERNEEILDIASMSKYQNNIVGIANLNDGSLYGPDKLGLHGGLTNPHFSSNGYFYLANKWLSEIRRCVRDNPSLFY